MNIDGTTMIKICLFGAVQSEASQHTSDKRPSNAIISRVKVTAARRWARGPKEVNNRAASLESSTILGRAELKVAESVSSAVFLFAKSR